MTFRDELQAAYARIAALEQQLEQGAPLRESDALRSMTDELRKTKAELEEERAVRNAEKSAFESWKSNLAKAEAAKQKAQEEIARAEKEHAKAVQEATTKKWEMRVEEAEQARKRSEQELELLAVYSRAAALRHFRQQRDQYQQARAALATQLEKTNVGEPPGPGATNEALVAFEIAKITRERVLTNDRAMALQEERYQRICTLLEQPPKE